MKLDCKCKPRAMAVQLPIGLNWCTQLSFRLDIHENQFSIDKVMVKSVAMRTTKDFVILLPRNKIMFIRVGETS